MQERVCNERRQKLNVEACIRGAVQTRLLDAITEVTPVTIEMIKLVFQTSPLNSLVIVVSSRPAYFSVIAPAAVMAAASLRACAHAESIAGPSARTKERRRISRVSSPH